MKVLIAFFCLSLAVFETSARYHNRGFDNEFNGERPVPFEPMLNEVNDEPSFRPMGEEDERHHDHHGHHGGHGHHKHHGGHHKHHHGHHKQEKHPGHDLLAKFLPMLHSLVNQVHNKTGQLFASNDIKVEKEAKARAYVVSKFHTKVSETSVGKDSHNASKVHTKNIDQTGETNAVIDFNSEMEATNVKTLKAKQSDLSEPAHDKTDRRDSADQLEAKPANVLRRLRRQAADPANNPNPNPTATNNQGMQKVGAAIKSGWEKIVGAVKQAAQTVVEAYKTHVQPKGQMGQPGQPGQPPAPAATPVPTTPAVSEGQ